MAAKLPIGIQDFVKLRSEGYKYVDKTGIIYRLAKSGCYYFLSRPRRFGKSLFLSTLEAYFLGRKDLFSGLEIERLEQDWNEHPVFRLDLNTLKYDTPEKLQYVLIAFLRRLELKYGIESDQSDNLGPRFECVIHSAYEKTGRQVVILVDEYDKPMLEAIGRPELQEEYRAIFRGFYGALKSCDAWIRFAFLTGVTKFGKMSVFSGLNNLNDISMDAAYHDICGMTEEELHTSFASEIEDLAQANEMSTDQCLAALKKRYDGYHFHRSGEGIFNPYSLLLTLSKKEFGSYWFETGTPSYLVELLKKHDYNLSNLEKEEQTADELNSIDSTSSNPIPVIYQSGYLTIKGYDSRFGLYKLGFPNEEVEEGFVKFLIPYYTNVEKTRSGFEVSLFVREIESRDIEGFMLRLQAFLSNCPYELQPEQERHFQSVMYILTTLCGFYTEVEEHTSKGRMDMTIKTDKYIYIFEFKFNASAQAALKQIEETGYADKFREDNREVICVGVNYSSEARNIDTWLIG